MRFFHRYGHGRLLSLVVVAFGGACQRPSPDAPLLLAPTAVAVEDTSRWTATTIGESGADNPWITQVEAADLDHDGRTDVIVCDAQANTVTWLRQTAAGVFSEQVLAKQLAAPVHASAADLDGDGDLDLLIACLGQIFPSNEKIGSVVILENDGQQQFAKRVVVDHVARVADVRAADLDGDGRPDLAVAQFGYDQGEIRWMRNLGGGRFASETLLHLAGAINVGIADLDGDGIKDLIALVSQQWEEIHLFKNDGRGAFTATVIYGSTNEDYGSSGLSLCDLNRDGRPDILYTNGDGFDYADPGARPWHGVQWLENLGAGNFRYHRIGDLPGAHSPLGVDLDGDGATDVVAVSGFNDWKNPAAASLVLFRNDGHQNFLPHVLARAPTHLITCVAGDFAEGGRPALITGGFHAYPPFERMSRLTLWRQKS